jgi:methionine synthase I (cobalamin-dependent)
MRHDRGMSRLDDLLAPGTPVLADGAMGTMLFEIGLSSGDPPEAWNVLHPDRVRLVHRGYLEAGARIVLTNTFGGGRYRLAMHNLEKRVTELNRTAAVLLRAEVDAAGTGALVAGDIGPSGEILEPLGTLAYGDAVDAFAEQADALVAGGADVLWVETLAAIEEMQAAFEGIGRVAPGIPVIATMTFDTHGRTMFGVTPEAAAEALLGFGAAAVGGNCGNGADEVLEVVRRMRAATAPDATIVAKANAGRPQLVGDRAVYPAAPDDAAVYAREAVAAGARIVGGCCGTTAAHVAAMGAALAG